MTFTRSHLAAIGLSIAALLSACGGGDGGGGGEGEAVAYTVSGGVAQKGPLIKGSLITAQELDAKLSPTGKQYTYQIQSDLGTFAPTSGFTSRYIGLIATGYYFDEVTNKVSEAPVTLQGYSDLSATSVVNVNLLTTLAYQRVQHLVAKQQLPFAQARTQAEAEVLRAFGIRGLGSAPPFDALDIGKASDANRMLAALSSLLVSGNNAGQLAVLIGSLQGDLGANGAITSASSKAALAQAAKTLDPAAAAANLNARYAGSGLTFTAADIGNWIDRDGDGVIGKHKFVQADANAAASYTSDAYVAGAADDGQVFTVTAGTLLVNGVVAPKEGAKVKAGDALAIRLTSGAELADVARSYLVSNGVNVASFRIDTVSTPMTLVATISKVGFVNDLALSADGSTLYVGTTDTCDPCTVAAMDGGLWAFDVTNPGAPALVHHVQHPNQGYRWASYQVVRVSPDGQSVVVGSGSQLQVFRAAQLLAPPFTVTTSNNQAFLTFTLLPGVGAAANASGFVLEPLLQANATIASTAPRVRQVYHVDASPDGTQVAYGSHGLAEVVTVSGGTLGAASDITGVVTYPRSLAYVGNKTALLVGESIAIVDLANPASPRVLGQIALAGADIYRGMAGVVYQASSKLAYVAIAQDVHIVDVADASKPVIRGSIRLPALPSKNFGAEVVNRTGLAISPDGKTLYVTRNGDVSIVRIGS